MKITPPYCTLCVQVFITESESESEQQKVIALLYSSNKSRHGPNSNGIELVYTFKNVCFFWKRKIDFILFQMLNNQQNPIQNKYVCKINNQLIP